MKKVICFLLIFISYNVFAHFGSAYKNEQHHPNHQYTLNEQDLAVLEQEIEQQNFNEEEKQKIIDIYANFKYSDDYYDKYILLSASHSYHLPSINEALISLLDEKPIDLSKTNVALPMPLREGSILNLSKKFPESEVAFWYKTAEQKQEIQMWIYHENTRRRELGLDSINQDEYNQKLNSISEKNFQQAKAQFLTWWEENKDNIEYYGDNQYRIVGQDAQKSQPTQTTQTTQTTETPINPSLLADNTTPNAQPANQAKQEAKTEKITAEPAQDKPTNWIIYVLAAVLLLIILIVLKLKKTK